jgi:hypothetical protein
MIHPNSKKPSFGASHVLIFLSLLFIAGCSSITQDQAIRSAQDFVDMNVKFYSGTLDEENISDQHSVLIDIVNVYKQGNEWNIAIIAKSNATGELKKKGMMIIVDAKTGKVNPEKISAFNIP